MQKCQLITLFYQNEKDLFIASVPPPIELEPVADETDEADGGSGDGSQGLML